MPLSKYADDHSAKASLSRVQTIREGMENHTDKRLWIKAAEARIEELDLRCTWFGLEEFETDERRQLQELVAE